MLNNRILRSKKAISPILATLLLIVIAVAAIVVTYAWIMTYMSNAGQQAGVQLYEANVRFFTGGIEISVGNSGTSNTQITKVYVGTSLANRAEYTTTPALPQTLNAGSIVALNVTYSWASGTTYYFRVLSSSGQPLEWSKLAS
jgi:flagellin-like protein